MGMVQRPNTYLVHGKTYTITDDYMYGGGKVPKFHPSTAKRKKKMLRLK